MEKMVTKTDRNILYYAAGDTCSDLFVEVELISDLYRKKEEELIDKLMEKFYKEYDEKMREIIKESQMSLTKNK